MVSKHIIIQEETDELLNSLRVGDESYNSIIFRNLKETKKNDGSQSNI